MVARQFSGGFHGKRLRAAGTVETNLRRSCTFFSRPYGTGICLALNRR
jgi:hypothetical protein